ncbi:MAG: tRNA nucleotidyltransferase/polyA polymerase [Candidatus Phytoplasma cynodontis]|uniref:CCA tRNA nucleotidyltransferase n=1 Tax='Cynodon dactylon' phytoplasma TaxID=295320 RepID=UPI001265BCDD|nr:CCA tRNA nucleotidyltransferase ['Cynodon dactylon' phytoplasma]KAB8122019.1 CCA tRNA nucleotidyltransferase ['Cynodon dactylon' phytoplasma]WIA07565.1 MAG: tRNA nucleotidyltransferase/polyA polymerase [Candidatus Phytoplasma cynodontis]
MSKNILISESKYKIKKSQELLKILKKKGFEAYIVGGAIRDFLSNISFDDIDITTNASIEEIKKNFEYIKKSFREKYGTVKVYFEKIYFDITSYRKEGPYLDYRHPSYICFISDIKEDIYRRDFTINSILMDENNNLIDYFHGCEDLRKKKIRTIGDPYQKLTEDVVRMLRIFYLQAKLNFDIEINTLKVLIQNIFLLEKIKNEILIEELKKIFSQKYLKKAFLDIKKTNAIVFLRKLKNCFPILSEIEKL